LPDLWQNQLPSPRLLPLDGLLIPRKTPSITVDSNGAHINSELENQQWLADSGANDHITNDLENLSLQQPFKGNDSVAVDNGAGLEIENTGSTILNSKNYHFHLKNVLHCPHAATKLLSIQKFC
jgi:hypothetical protein